MTEKKLPTRDELIGSARRRLGCDDGGLSCSHRADAVSIVDDLIERGWVTVAPEPAAEPSDPENYIAKSGERYYVHDPVNSFGWVNDLGYGCYWANIKRPTLFRKVDTPEPAPKYVAMRDDDGWITVEGRGSIAPSIPRTSIRAWRDYAAKDFAKYQAVLDLIDSEEKKKEES